MDSPASSAAAPRVYVPITHPDSPVPAYAVLQFVGLSASPGSVTLLPASSPLPHNLLLPSTILNLPPSSSSSSPAHLPAQSCSDGKLTSLKPSPMKKSPGSSCGTRSPVARRSSAGKNLAPAPSISITHTEKDTIIHADTSNFRDIVHQLTGASSGDKNPTPACTMSANISSWSGEKDLMMPMNLPARSMAGNVNVKQESSSSTTSPKLAEMGGVKRPAGHTTKLLQRRKSSKVLDSLITSCRDLPPLVPSPVTPLAAEFEKIRLPLSPTPSTSQANSPVVSVAMASMPLHDVKVMDVLPIASPIPSHADKARDVASEDGMDVQGASMSPCSEILRASSIVNAMDVQTTESTQEGLVMQPCSRRPQVSGVLGSSSSQSEGSSWVTWDSNMSLDEEEAIVRKGFFLHADRPRKADPTLLPLFPESPSQLLQ